MSDTGGFSSPPLMLTRASALVAVGVALGYLLAPVPNVELVTATCFCAGYLLGLGAGVLCSVLIETLFAGFHPMGSSFGLTLIAQVLGMAGAGAVGALARRVAFAGSSMSRAIVVTVLGVVATIWFDTLSNLAFPVAAGFSFDQALVTLGLAAPFAAIHLVSNALVFLLIVAPLLPKIVKLVEQPL